MNAKQLLEALALPLEIADRKADAAQIVAYVRLAEGKATAFNWRAAVEITLEAASFDCCVPAARVSGALNTIAALAGEAEVKMAVKGTRFTLSAGRVRYQMPTLRAQDFPTPQWPKNSTPIADWPTIAAAMRFAVHACTMNDVRPFCHGIGTRDGWLAGTDGHRAAIARWDGRLPDKLVLPLQAIATLAALPVAAYSASDTSFAVEFDGGRYCVQQLAASYPDAGRVVPDKHGSDPLSIDRAALAAAAAAILKTKSQTFCRFILEGDTLTLEDESASEGSHVHIELPCTNPAARTWSTGINIAYLTQACEALDGEQLTISLTEDLFRLAGKTEGRAVATKVART